MVIFFVSSCEQEAIETSKNDKDSKNDDILEIDKGSLVFDDYVDFRTSYKSLKQLSETELSFKLISSGHKSLRPIITKETMHLYEDAFIRKQASAEVNGGRLEEEFLNDEMIGDNLFAALLNQQGEILVADSIYKYTSFGVFIALQEKRDNLDSLVELFYKAGTSSGRVELEPLPCAIPHQFGAIPDQITTIDDGINFFYSAGCPGGGSGPIGGGGGGGGTGPIVTNQELLQNYLASKSPCQNFNGWWPFGQSKKCDEYFSDNSRVRSKVYNQNFYLWKAVGAESRHQFKSLIWYNADIDELYIGLRSAFYNKNLSADEVSTTYYPPSEERYIYYGDYGYEVTNGNTPKYCHCLRIFF